MLEDAGASLYEHALYMKTQEHTGASLHENKNKKCARGMKKWNPESRDQVHGPWRYSYPMIALMSSRYSLVIKV